MTEKDIHARRKMVRAELANRGCDSRSDELMIDERAKLTSEKAKDALRFFASVMEIASLYGADMTVAAEGALYGVYALLGGQARQISVEKPEAKEKRVEGFYEEMMRDAGKPDKNSFMR